MAVGIMRVEAEFLKQVLHLPSDTIIVDAQSVFGQEAIDLKIVHPDLKDTLAGCEITRVTPQHSRHLAVPERIEFTGWGQS